MRPFLFTLQTPRHPLARLALGLLGAMMLAGTVLLGFIVGALALLGLGGKRFLDHFRTPRDPGRAHNASPNVIEGEFSVVEKPRENLRSE